MEIIDGKKRAEERLNILKNRVDALAFSPSLAVVLVGDDGPSQLYVRLKEKAAKKVGIDFHVYKIAQNEPEDAVLTTINFLRDDPDITGIILQLPLPKGFDTDRLVAHIGVEKDADGFHHETLSRFITGDQDVVWPVFPKALIALAQYASDDIVGKRAVVIGKSDLFTRAMVAACTRVGMHITRVPCDKIACMQAAILSADIIFTACGAPKSLTKKYIKNNAIVIDGGISVVDGRTVGDVDQVSLSQMEGKLTPVPGGVGPMTVACLLENVVELAEKSHRSAELALFQK